MPIGKWQCFLYLRHPPPPPPPPPPTPMHQCSARDFSEARVRPCWRLSRSKHLHQYTSLYKCLILIIKRYGMNKHNLLTTSYFFDESGCEYSWINWQSEKIMDIDHIDIVLSLLWRLISIQLTNSIYFILLAWLAKICNAKDDPYLRIMTSLNKDFYLEIKH